MKKKINFSKPHFIIPLIVLPFLFILYYIFFRTDDIGEETKIETVQEQGLNPDLPNAKDDLETPDRLQAYQEEVRKRRMSTGMGDIEREERNKKLEEEGERKKKDSLQKEFSEAAIAKQKQASAAENRRRAIAAAETSRQALEKIRSKNQARNGNSDKSVAATQAALPRKEREMEAFKKQMNYLDSLQNPEKYAALANEQSEEDTEPVFELTKDDGSKIESNYFNTIKADLGKTMITAILDEGIKAWEGSRVRIRLLEPIFIDGRLLDKGQYLYGICETFKAQRLIITISSVVIDDEIFPMEVSLYDNDGIEGIYIPDSSFRTFSKELGANSAQGNVRIDQSPNSNTQALYQSLGRAVQSSSRAVQKALRKNKARLKYNTQVFLVNTKK